MKAIIFFALFISCALAHNWLKSPVSYNLNNNQGSQTRPCDSGDAGGAKTYVRQTEDGGSFPASWSTEHDGDHALYLVPLASKNNLENLTPTSADVKFYKTYANEVSSGTVSFSLLPAGDYILQYRWATYRNCAPLYIEHASPAEATPIDGATGKYQLEHGTYDAVTGEVTCEDGYKATDEGNDCKKKGMNGAAAFFLSIFIILIFLVICAVVLVVLRRRGVLTGKFADIVEKGENKVMCRRSDSTSTSTQKA